MLPEPITSTPCSRSGASARPTANWWAGPSIGWIDSGTTGMSACGIHQAQRHPGAVIQAAVGVHLRVEPGLGEPLRPPRAASNGVARRGVLQLIQRLGEPAEIVHRGRCGAPPTCGRTGKPVRAGHHDRTRPRQLAASSARRSPVAPGRKAVIGEPWEM